MNYLLARRCPAGSRRCIAVPRLLPDRYCGPLPSEPTPLAAGAETGSYKWKDYAPKVFQRLRQAFGIDNM